MNLDSKKGKAAGTRTMVTNACRTTSSAAPRKLVYRRTFARVPNGTMTHLPNESAREQLAHRVQLRLREILLHHVEHFRDLLER